MSKAASRSVAALALGAAAVVPFVGGAAGPADPPAPRRVAAASAQTATYNVETFEGTPGYRSPGTGEASGMLNAGVNYIYCKVKGPEVRRGGQFNTWWLKTDLSTGTPWQNQYISAFALARWGNDEAKTIDGAPIPDCEPGGGAGKDEAPSATEHDLNVHWEQQNASYNCGPTTVRMLLGLHGTQPSIADISETAGTTVDGTYRTGVAVALNHYQDRHEYQVKDVAGATEDSLRLALLDDVKKAIVQEGHGVALAFDGTMPGYRSFVQHWVAIVGIDRDKVLIADPTSGKGPGADLPPTYWVAIDDLPIKTWVF